MKSPLLPDKELTLKQARWLQLYTDASNPTTFGNATQSALLVYDCKDASVARNIGSENLSKLGISELMNDMGLTDHKLVLKVQEGLEATRSISAVSGIEANGGTVDFVEVPDYQTRHKYLETALKLKGKFPKENQPSVQVNVQANIEAQKAKYDI